MLGIGLAYLVVVLCTNAGLPCIFYQLTGWQCPGCGMSRMVLSLVRLDPVSAFHYNPFFFITLPIVLFCLLYSDIVYIRKGVRTLGKMEIVLWIEVVLALAFGVVRNLI